MDLGLGTEVLRVVKVRMEAARHLGPMAEMAVEERRHKHQAHGTQEALEAPQKEARGLGRKEEVDMVMVELGVLVAKDPGQGQEMAQVLRALADQGPGQVQEMAQEEVQDLRALADQGHGQVQEMVLGEVQDLKATAGQDPGQVLGTVEEQEALVEQGHGQVLVTAVAPNSLLELHHGTKEDMVEMEKQADLSHGLVLVVMVLAAHHGPVRAAMVEAQVRRDLGTAGRELALEHHGTKEDSVVAKEQHLAHGQEKQSLTDFLSLT